MEEEPGIAADTSRSASDRNMEEEPGITADTGPAGDSQPIAMENAAASENVDVRESSDAAADDILESSRGSEEMGDENKRAASLDSVAMDETQPVGDVKQATLAKESTLSGSGGDAEMNDASDEDVTLEEPKKPAAANEAKVDAPLKESAVPTTSEESLPVRKSQRAKTPSIRLSSPKATISSGKQQSDKQQSAPKTAKELYRQILKSRDKLFFVAYSHEKDPRVADKSDRKGNGKEKAKYQWCLVRVDLSTCQQLEETEDCENTGTYYVEFYMKASYDQGVLLLGYQKENGVLGADMKPKPDSDSRYWMEFHEYHFDKKGDMVVGKAKELIPNSKKNLHKRLLELAQRRRTGPPSPGSIASDGEERLASEYQVDFDKYTTWADVLDLMDTNTRLVGPFDFDDVKPPPPDEEDLKPFSEEMRKLFAKNLSNLYVKDRVHRRHWEELLKALEGRDIKPPTLSSVENKRLKTRPEEKQTASGSKRPRENVRGTTTSRASGQKRTKETQPTGPVCEDCGKAWNNQHYKLLHFPASSSRPALHIHPKCAATSGRKVVAGAQIGEEIVSMVQSVLSQTRQATTDTQKFYVLDELKQAFHQGVESLGGATEVGDSIKREARDPLPPKKVDKLKPPAQTPPLAAAVPLVGIPEEHFSEAEIESFPVAFAYHVDDPNGVSEENAKISTLDHEVEQRRLKRSTPNKGTEMPKTSHPQKTSRLPKTSHPRVSGREMKIDPEPTEFGDGWLSRKVPNMKESSDTRIRRYYYSPSGYRFRSKPEVLRFLAALKKSGGDEAVAITKV